MRVLDRVVIRPNETIVTRLFDLPGKDDVLATTLIEVGATRGCGVAGWIERKVDEGLFRVAATWRSSVGTLTTLLSGSPGESRSARATYTGEARIPVRVTLDVDPVVGHDSG